MIAISVDIVIIAISHQIEGEVQRGRERRRYRQLTPDLLFGLDFYVVLGSRNDSRE
jgi:hypothetical protein